MSQDPVESPRIKRITLENIGPFDRATFEPLEPTGPGEIVLFEGPNGSGKSTILEAIAVVIGAAGRSFKQEAGWVNISAEMIRQILTTNLGNFDPRGDTHPTPIIPTAPPVTSLLRRAHGEAYQVVLELSSGDSVALAPKLNSVVWETHSHVSSKISAFGVAADKNTSTDWAAFAFRGTQPTASLETEGPKRIDRPPLRGALSFAEVFPASADLGQVLVNLYFDHLQVWRAAEMVKGTPEESALRAQADAQQASLDRIARALTDVLSRDVKIEFAPRQRPPILRFGGEIIPLDLLGEGFRRTLAWLTDLCVRLELTRWEDTTKSPFDQDFWLLLDEIDQSLHPALQRHILPALRKLFPNARIYATTHSPFIVASAPDGCVFRIRPDLVTHRVSGTVTPLKLGPGHSLSWAIEEVFNVPSTFVDEKTVQLLTEHKAMVDRLRRGELQGFDWEAFAKVRAPLIETEGEGRAIVQLTEAPVRALIDKALLDLAKDAHEAV